MDARTLYDSLPPAARALNRHLVGAADKTTDGPTDGPSVPQVTRRRGQPNKTESEYARAFLSGMYARFEGLTVRLLNGHRYTPDWVVVRPDGGIECHEVKGGYSLHSERSARMAFDSARVEWPGWRWVWARKGRDGWTVDG